MVGLLWIWVVVGLCLLYTMYVLLCTEITCILPLSLSWTWILLTRLLLLFLIYFYHFRLFFGWSSCGLWWWKIHVYSIVTCYLRELIEFYKSHRLLWFCCFFTLKLFIPRIRTKARTIFNFNRFNNGVHSSEPDQSSSSRISLVSLWYNIGRHQSQFIDCCCCWFHSNQNWRSSLWYGLLRSSSN